MINVHDAVQNRTLTLQGWGVTWHVSVKAMMMGNQPGDPGLYTGKGEKTLKGSPERGLEQGLEDGLKKSPER